MSKISRCSREPNLALTQVSVTRCVGPCDPPCTHSSGYLHGDPRPWLPWNGCEDRKGIIHVGLSAQKAGTTTAQ